MNLIEREQIAAQLVALMDAHFSRPDAGEKRIVLRLADEQISASGVLDVLENFNHAAK